ncbi:MAG: hypothetical protein KDE33_24465 [Bacteroidetes bacterium]|nr:hypothetical protein [Bacteroidota bacterium]
MIDWIKNIDPRITAAIVAALVSMLTLIISLVTKNFMEKKIHSFKLTSEHEFEQKKKIKSILSENKIRLINACESMNHRFYNFSNNHNKQWHFVNIEKHNPPDGCYYYISFIYRILAVLSWTRKIEKEMVYLDSTIASTDDLIFIKYLRLFSFCFCDLDTITKGFKVDTFIEKDHFFRHNFDEMSGILLNGNELVSYDSFEEEFADYYPKMDGLCKFIDGINEKENRLRWDRLQLFHLSIIGFLNRYGYDYQKWDNEKIKNVFSKSRKTKFLDNYKSLIQLLKLDKEKHLMRVIKHAKQ